MPSAPVISVPTPFGTVQVTTLNDHAVMVSAGSSDGIGGYETLPLKINGVEIAMRYHLEIAQGHRMTVADSAWEIAYSSARPRPLDWRSMNDQPSGSARRKIRDVVLPAVVAVLDAQPEVLAEAQDAARLRKIQSINTQIQQKLDEVRALQAELAALVDE